MKQIKRYLPSVLPVLHVEWVPPSDKFIACHTHCPYVIFHSVGPPFVRRRSRVTGLCRVRYTSSVTTTVVAWWSINLESFWGYVMNLEYLCVGHAIHQSSTDAEVAHFHFASAPPATRFYEMVFVPTIENREILCISCFFNDKIGAINNHRKGSTNISYKHPFTRYLKLSTEAKLHFAYTSKI